jgi:response regulator RpfG family c-di-GMP phosphodiesterase
VLQNGVTFAMAHQRTAYAVQPTLQLTTMIRKRKILVVDESIHYREMLSQIISQLNASLEVQILWDTAHLLHYISSRDEHADISLIILGLRQLTPQAIGMIHQLSADSLYREIPIVVSSWSDLPENKSSVLNAGAKDYFIKPAKASGIKLMARQMLAFCRIASSQPG